MTTLLIGELAERTGVPAPTIRYYESIGLLEPPARTQAGYRRYSERTLSELLFIRKSQALGFALDEIAEILRLSRSGETPCAHVLTLAESHLAAVDERLRQLQRFREYLATELAKWKRQETAETCDGLCDFITAAEPELVAGAVNAGLPPRRRRRRR